MQGIRCPTTRAAIGSPAEAQTIASRVWKGAHVERCPYCGWWHVVGGSSRRRRRSTQAKTAQMSAPTGPRRGRLTRRAKGTPQARSVPGESVQVTLALVSDGEDIELLLEQAASLLGTTSAEETIRAALGDVIRRGRHLIGLEHLSGSESATDSNDV